MKTFSDHRFLRQALRFSGFAVAMAFLFTACQDAPVAPDAAPVTDPYAVSKIDLQGLKDFSEIPSFEEVVAGQRAGLGKLMGGDSTHHGDSLHHEGDSTGHDTTHHDPDPVHHDSTHHDPDPIHHDSTHHDPDPVHHDSTHHDPNPVDTTHHADTTHHDLHHGDSAHAWHGFQELHEVHVLLPHSYRHLTGDLHLSHEQDSLFRRAISIREHAVGDAFHAYKSARSARFDSLSARLHELHDLYHNGSITEQQARERMDVLVAAYRSDIEPFGTALTAAVEAADAELDRTVRAFLDADQIMVWEKMK